MAIGDKTKLLWQKPEYRKHMKEIHKGLIGSKSPSWKGGKKLAQERHKPKEKETMRLYRIKNKEKISKYNKNWNKLNYISHPLLRKPKCIDCNQEIKGYVAKRCQLCWEKFNRKENHYNWQGGISKNPYPEEFNAELKLKIRTRDNFTCCLCGRTEREELEELNRVLSVNHKNFDKNDCREENLNTLCLRCNVKINRERDYWTDYFNNK